MGAIKRRTVRIGTRKSRLALVQTNMVAEAIEAACPEVKCELVPLMTKGDKILKTSLVAFGGKGAFVEEFEQSILNGDIDLAVHSAKDMPMDLSDGLCIGAVLKREDPRDVFVTVKGRTPERSPRIIGTGSPRRQVQIMEHGDVECRLLREADAIAIPGKEIESCTAYQIALGAVPEIEEKEIIPVVFPMTKDEAVLKESHEAAVKSLAALMDQGKTVAFLTLGDVTVYSTYGYVHKKLLALGYESVLINGVPSFCAAAAKLGISLGEKAESIHILPGSYPVKDGLKLSGTKILMKSGKKIADVKRELLLTECPAWMVENCGMEGERLIRSAADIPEDAGYYSLIIAKDREEQ